MMARLIKKGHYHMVMNYSMKERPDYGSHTFQKIVLRDIPFEEFHQNSVEHTNNEMGEKYGGECESVLINFIKI